MIFKRQQEEDPQQLKAWLNNSALLNLSFMYVFIRFLTRLSSPDGEPNASYIKEAL